MVDGCCWTPLSFANLSLPSPRDVKPKRPSARNSSGNFASGETKNYKKKSVCRVSLCDLFEFKWPFQRSSDL